MSIPVHVANSEPFWQSIGGKMPIQSKPALPVSKEKSHDIESARIYCDIQIPVFVKIARRHHFWQD